MTILHIFTEELSLKVVLDKILPKILPDNVTFKVYPHQGKQDLEKALRTTLPSISKIPGSKILVTRDQDNNDCKDLKQSLVNLVHDHCHCQYSIRIVCRELEAWYLGDMDAIESAYPRFKASQHNNKADYRHVDKIISPNKALLRLIPNYSALASLPKLEVADNISPYLKIEGNTSESFNQTLAAIKQLAS